MSGDLRKESTTKEQLWDWYWNQGLSTPAIARLSGRSHSTIGYWMAKHRIPVRPLQKYPRAPFGGKICEKAYLIGLRLGDLHARREGQTIVVDTTSTHPAMLELFRACFERYGKVREFPCYNKQTRKYYWVTRTSLDLSFLFLVKKHITFPLWITNRRKVFMSFLAGFFDAEGSMSVVFRARKRRRNVAEPSLSISNTNKTLLQTIASKLKDYHPSLTVGQKGGTVTSVGGTIRRHDQWKLAFYRRASIRYLIENLPIRHSEKIRKSRLVTEVLRRCDWDKQKLMFRELKKEIGNEVSALAMRAALSLDKNDGTAGSE